MDIRKREVNGHTYFALYKNNKFVRHIGNAEKLKVFQRDMQMGQEAAELLKERPYLNPKASLSIIASRKKDLVGKIPLPDKQYRTIVIDPPWPIEKILRDKRTNQTAFDYPTMEIEEIKALPINKMAFADGCHIYLWTTQKYLPIAFEVLASWGVEYQCLMTWVKNVYGQRVMVVTTPDADMKENKDFLLGNLGIAYRRRRFKLTKYGEVSIRNSRTSGTKTEKQKILDGECKAHLFIWEFEDAWVICTLEDVMDALQRNIGYAKTNNDGITSAYYISTKNMHCLISRKEEQGELLSRQR